MVRTSKERGYTPIAIEFKTEVLNRLRQDARADQRSVAFLVRQIVDLHYAEIDAGRGEHYRPVEPTPDNPSGLVRVFPASAPSNISVLHKSDETAPPAKPHLQINVAPPKRPIAAKQFDPPTDEPEDEKS
jgi:hypothetical protein